MTQLSDLQPTTTLSMEDETLVRQLGVDRRISMSLVTILSWADRWGKQYLQEHAAGVTFTSEDQFTIYNGRAYFPTRGTTFPYVSNVPNPTTDPRLTGLVYADSHHTHDFLEALYPVGAAYVSFSARNPSTFLGGTWELVTGDAVLSFGDGTELSRSVVGDNEKDVPLPKHGHGGSVQIDDTDLGTVSTSYNGAHSHTRGSMNITGWNSGAGGFEEGATFGGAFYSRGLALGGPGSNRDHLLGFDASRSWTGHTSQASNHNHTVVLGSHGHVGTLTADDAGVDDAKINVKGATIPINVWVRTA
ncbi:putative tail fiber protein [Vibrio phage RYC]|nr:putative tail fiber protein [Vibrio phage RYC]